MFQSKFVNNIEKSWKIDISIAKKIQSWVSRYPQLFQREIEEMKTYFPRWFLTLAKNDGKVVSCGSCRNTLVPSQGKILCLGCNREYDKFKSLNLSWVGQLPVVITGRKKLLKKINSKYDPAFPLVELNNELYWLVPVTVVYPENYPSNEPACYYPEKFFEITGNNKFGSSSHIVGGNRMCLFSYNEWDGLTVREVLQQRVINHLISTTKIADGMPPNKAFIGGNH